MAGRRRNAPSRRPSKGQAIVLGVAVAGGAAGFGVNEALASDDASHVFSACLNSDHELTQVFVDDDTVQCKDGTKVTWNQQGQPGADGPQGPAGPGGGSVGLPDTQVRLHVTTEKKESFTYEMNSFSWGATNSSSSGSIKGSSGRLKWQNINLKAYGDDSDTVGLERLLQTPLKSATVDVVTTPGSIKTTRGIRYSLKGVAVTQFKETTEPGHIGPVDEVSLTFKGYTLSKEPHIPIGYDG